MCKGFSPNYQELLKFSSGNLGIAKSIFESDLAILISNNANIEGQIKSIYTFKEGLGLDALEKVIVSSFLETLGPVTKLSEALLDLFAGIEWTITHITGGLSPDGIEGSFNWSLNKKGKIQLPKKIFLLKLNSNSLPEIPNPDELGEYQYFKDWNHTFKEDEWTSKNLYESDSYLNSLEPNKKNDATLVLTNSFKNEWNTFSKNRKLKTVFFKDKIKLDNKDLKINIESDYIIKEVQTEQWTLYYADLIENDTTSNGSKFITPNVLKVPFLISSKVITPIQDKVIEALNLIEDILSKPDEFLTQILNVKLKEHCIFLGLKNDKTNPLYSVLFFDGKCILDGWTSIKILGKEIGIGIYEGDISNVKQDKENAFLKTIINFIKMPIDIIVGIIKAIKDMLSDIIKPDKILKTYNDFITFKWLTDLLSKENLLKFLGAVDGKIPFLGNNLSGEFLNDTIKKLLMLIQELINALIKLISNIFCIEIPQIKLV